MAEGRVSEIVAERNRFRQIFIETQAARNRTRQLHDLEAVREAGAIVIAQRRKKYLRLVHQAPEGFAVDNAVAVALKARADEVVGFGRAPPARILRKRSEWGQRCGLARFELLANACYRCHGIRITPGGPVSLDRPSRCLCPYRVP